MSRIGVHLRVGVPAIVIALWGLVSLCAPLLSLTPNLVELPRVLEPPGPGAVFGYDELGRPLMDRLIAGARTSFLVALLVVSASLVVGTAVGVLSAWRGGVIDHAVTRVIDVFLAFPGILLAIALSGVLGPGLDNVVIALTAVGWVGFARLARAQTLSVKHREHVRAAVALGSPVTRVLVRHVLPMIAAPLIVEATFGIAAVIVAEAGLSFLGLGVQPPAASWGSVIREGTRYMLVAPHVVLVPSLALLIVVLAANLLGDSLRDHLDVRTRHRTRGHV